MAETSEDPQSSAPKAPKRIIKLSDPERHAFWKLPVLLEQDGLLALEKPSHFLVSPEKQRADDPVLTKCLQRDVSAGATWAKERGYTFLDILYSIDFEASGAIVFATDKSVFAELKNHIGSRQVVFTFLAIVHGHPPEDEFSSDLKLEPHPARGWMMRVHRSKGKQSITHSKVLERFRSCSLVEIQTRTLRPHQARVHLQFAGFPVLGDALYGGEMLLLSQLKRKYRSKKASPEKPLIDRAAVHLAKVQFTLPETEKEFIIESAPPKDLAVTLKFLRQFSR